jgi:hypothetical protein
MEISIRFDLYLLFDLMLSSVQQFGRPAGPEVDPEACMAHHIMTIYTL